MGTLRFIGASSGAALVLLLLLTIRGDARYAIWPVPVGAGWRSLTFWGLFRCHNAASLLYLGLSGLALGAAGDRSIVLVRAIGAFIGVLCALLFVAAGVRLGRDALYGRGDGLEMAGFYRFSRNPQYTAAIIGYAAAALFAWSLAGVMLASLAIGVYGLMARAEEPWLVIRYGPAYERYCARVPRFFGLRSLLALGAGGQPGPETATMQSIDDLLRARRARRVRGGELRAPRSRIPAGRGE